MKKTIIIAVIGIALGVGAGWAVFHRTAGGDAASGPKVLYYRDPMNPQMTSPTPKKAPDGMDYVPVYGENEPAPGERKILYYKDPMHPWYTSDKPGKAPDCGMDLVPVYEGEAGARGIRIDPVTVQNIGVRVEEVQRRKLTRTIRTAGQVTYDERRLYTVNTKVMGWVERLFVDYTGKRVRKGEPLLELYSPELVTTQEEYLQALKYQKSLHGSTLDEAKKGSDELIESARRRLLNWDIPASEIDALEERGTARKTMTMYAPADGVVTEKAVQNGQNIMAGAELYKIADLSDVWVIADIYQYELPWVKTGENADVELSYLPGRTFKGKVTYIYPFLNDETKTAKVRVEIRNTPGLELKPDMYATVTIASPVAIDAIAVPSQAIIRSGERNIVVIALGGGYFDPREVKLGVAADEYVQVLEGVRDGDKIVVSSQFLIDSESNLKAAIDQMAGHTGTDMSKPAEGAKPGGEEQKKEPGPAEGGAGQKSPSGHEGMQHGMQGMAEPGAVAPQPGSASADNATGAEKSLYTCVMHPEVVSDKPGNCPKCGMKLVPRKAS